MAKKQFQPPELWDRLFAPSSCLAMISTIDNKRRMNIGSYGTCTRVCHDPVHIAFTTGMGKDTTNNVVETGEFVVNLPSFTEDLIGKVQVAGIVFDPGVSEFDQAGLTPSPSRIVRVPAILECSRNFECRVEWTHKWAGRLMVVGRVVAASVDEGCVDENGMVIWDKVKPAHYCGASYDNMFVPAYAARAFENPYKGPIPVFTGVDRSAAEKRARTSRSGPGD